MARAIITSRPGRRAAYEPLYDIDPRTGASIEIFYADRVLAKSFDAVWVPDHYYFERPWGIDTFPDVWTLLTAIAVKTEKVRLGLSTTPLPKIGMRMCAVDEPAAKTIVPVVGAK